MAAHGASNDPKWIENEIYALEKTLGMYQIYAKNASKDTKAAWQNRLHVMEERVAEARKKLEKVQAGRR